MSIQLTDADIGKKFRTRGGDEAVVTSRNGSISYPFAAREPATGCGYTVTTEGNVYQYAPEHAFDLIERIEEPNTDGEPPADSPERRHTIPVTNQSVQNVLRTLPLTAAQRKLHPIVTGVLDYFPLAIAEVARISKAGNDQHNPGEPLHWARHKSADHVDCIGRHLIERGSLDTDGQRHTAKAAWRVLALLQEELEAEANWAPVPEA